MKKILGRLYGSLQTGHRFCRRHVIFDNLFDTRQYKTMYKVRIVTIWIILILLLAWEVESFGKRRCLNRQKNSKDEGDRKIFYNPLTDSKEDCIDPYSNCETVGFGIVQKISYLPVPSCCVPVNVQFSSACIRCGLCLAVAEQINQTLLDTHDTLQSDQWLNDSEALSLFKEICEHAFRHYSLREIGGKRYICDRIPGATFVTSTADGQWETNLRNKCTAYVAAAGALNLYKHWQRWSGFDRRLPDFGTILCRGQEGIFRDCKSIPNISRPEPKRSDSFFAKMRVMVELKCK